MMLWHKFQRTGDRRSHIRALFRHVDGPHKETENQIRRCTFQPAFTAGDNCALNILGRYIRLPYHGTEGHKTIGNWYTTLLDAHGNPIEHYGDFDLAMDRLKLDQTGAIKPFSFVVRSPRHPRIHL